MLAAVACAPSRAPSAKQSALAAEPEILVAMGSVWRYQDDGTDQGSAWQAPAFDDGAWKSGPAQLGYGEGDEATLIDFGLDPNDKYVTTYFRHEFQVADPSMYRNLVVRALHDDGAAIYLNGTEVYREDLPPGPLATDTLAPTKAIENLYIIRNIEPRHLLAGRNVLAVEVHQQSRDSTDLSFDLQLTANESLVVTRGPYLQMGSPTAATIRWRTDLPAPTRVRCWPAAGAPAQVIDDPAPTTEHIVRVTGLEPDTRYFYEIGTPDMALAGGDEGHTFVTPPPVGTPRPTRIWVIGDSGKADQNAAAVRDAYKMFAGGRHTDLWLMLGDNAYDAGSDDQYQKAVFELYPELLRQVFLWPALGNHEMGSWNGRTMPYLEMFSLPTRGEVGGLPSGTELYYSFDFANMHFVVLDSMISSRASDGAMLTWLREDLAATDKTWLVAYWHHPPYSKGNHDSDTELQLKEMRENALPILEEHGVDLVLAGHSHCYERSYLLDGHYGPSNTLTGAMKKDHGDGRVDGSGAYVKSAGVRGARDGAVYVVAGNAGLLTPGPLDHPAMLVRLMQLGSLVLDVTGNELSAAFLRDTGEIQDRFTIRKGVPAPSAPPAAPSDLTAMAVPPTGLRLDWIDHAGDEVGFVIEQALPGQPVRAFQEIARVGANATWFDGEAPAAGVVSTYRVRAFNAAGLSPSSNEVSFPLSGDGGAGAVVPPAPPMEQGCSCDTGSDGGRATPWSVAATLALAMFARRRRARGERPGAAASVLAVAFVLAGPGVARGHDTVDGELAALDAAIEGQPDNARLYLRRSDLLRERGLLEAAIADLSRAEALEPSLPGIDYLQARAFFEAGRHREAKAALDRYLSSHPDDGRALLLRGRAGAALGEVTAAADLSRALARLGSEATPEEHLFLVGALRAAGDAEGALRALDAALAALGPIVSLELPAVELEVAKKRWDRALVRLDRLMATSPRKERWLAERGHILEAAGRPHAARRAFVAALEAIDHLPAHLRATRATLKLRDDVTKALAR
jgi:MYXO-CTERM domain-containing protein